MEYCPSLGDALVCLCIENFCISPFLSFLNFFECVTDLFLFSFVRHLNVCIHDTADS